MQSEKLVLPYDFVGNVVGAVMAVAVSSEKFALLFDFVENVVGAVENSGDFVQNAEKESAETEEERQGPDVVPVNMYKMLE